MSYEILYLSTVNPKWNKDPIKRDQKKSDIAPPNSKNSQ